MALKPCLKMKVDELFLSWLTEIETQTLLKTNLRQLLKGEPMTRAPPPPHQPSHGTRPGNSVHLKQQSPRLRPSSPQAPPCAPSIASPRSPRPRSLGAKTSGWQGPANHKTNANRDTGNVTEKREIPVVDNRLAPDGEASSFLRQKRDELNQKRQDRLNVVREKEPTAVVPASDVKVSAAGDATGTVVVVASSPADTVLVPENLVVNSVATANRESTKKAESISSNENKDLPTTPTSTTVPIKTKQTTDAAVSKRPAITAAIATTSTPAAAADPVVSPSVDLPSVPASTSVSRPLPQLSQNAASGSNLPQFYFPMGRPADTAGSEVLLQKVKEEFDNVEGGKITKAQMGPIAKACGIPLYWKSSFFRYLNGEKAGHITLQSFLASWKKMSSSSFDAAARFMCIMAKPGRSFMEFDDFLPLVQDVVDTHPGLKFLQDAPEFHSRYVQTVISRIFYCVNRSWTGRITTQEIRKSSLLTTIELLEEEEDINQIVDFFSYEHFYVIYCKFWELDTDHDLLVSKEDLSRHNDHAISSRMIDRIFSGAVTRNLVDGKLSYRDFVWFLISEEDKRHPRSVEYWFRCMDLDGDGIISMYEMEYFYEEQVQKMEMLGIETLPFMDCLCQMLDMIRPDEEGKIRLKDLKSCSLTPIFFDTFFNLDKYLEHEQKDPFASIRDRESDEPEMTDWERFAAEEYELLVAEEGANDMQPEDMVYEDDFEPEEVDAEGANVQEGKQKTGVKKAAAPLRETSPKKEDIYDFSSNDLGY